MQHIIYIIFFLFIKKRVLHTYISCFEITHKGEPSDFLMLGWLQNPLSLGSSFFAYQTNRVIVVLYKTCSFGLSLQSFASVRQLICLNFFSEIQLPPSVDTVNSFWHVEDLSVRVGCCIWIKYGKEACTKL